MVPQTPALQANVDKPQAGKSRITLILADEVQERLGDARIPSIMIVNNASILTAVVI